MQFFSIQRSSPAIILLLCICGCTTMLAEITSLEIRIRNSHKKVGTIKCSLKFIRHLEKFSWKLTAAAFPPTCMALNCNHVHDVSSCVERINVKCTPRDLWTAEQSMHRNTPYVTLAHVGLLAPQSKHCYKEKNAQTLLKILLRYHKYTKQWCILNTEGYNFKVAIDISIFLKNRNVDSLEYSATFFI